MSLEDYCRQHNICISYFEFTTKIKGLCLKKGSYYLIVINPKFSEGSQKKTFKHEVIHIMENHFECTQDEIDQCECDINNIINDFKFEFADESFIDLTLL